MKKHYNYIYIILIGLLLITFVYSIFSFVKYYISIDPVTVQTDMKIRILPPLLGSFFSGIVAISIFYLTKVKEDLSKKNQSKMLLGIIETEIKTNLESVVELSELIKSTDSGQLANLLCTEKIVQEKFKVLSSNLSIEVIDKFLIQLNKDDYLLISQQYKKFKNLITSLDMINNEVNDEENKLILIKRIKKIFELLDGKTVSNSIGNKDKFFNANNILLLVLYSILNFLLIKFLI